MRARRMRRQARRVPARDQGVEPNMASTTDTLRSAPAATVRPALADRGVWPQLLSLLQALAASRRHRRRLALLALALVGVVCTLAYGQIKLNTWNGTFYDLL